MRKKSSKRQTHQLTLMPTQGRIRWNQMDLQQERFVLDIRKNFVVLRGEIRRLRVMRH